jgi:predicted nucleic acid-binding protein
VASFTALYDACVLYPAPLRDLLLHLAQTGLFRARWSEEIHDEWINSLLLKRHDLGRGQLQRTRDLMDAAVPDCIVTGFQCLIPSIQLPDPEDRHVLAAAIHGRADVIVTFNLKDFPETALGAHGIEVQHPDEFVGHLLDLAPDQVCAAVERQRANLKNPPKSVDELLATLDKLGLTRSVAQLRSLL